ncbi:transmembrane protein 184C [Dorcoceras hygrometricum]|uniref:Transmembrane protein 184C n=1 Tax=Dorcoceras hygrometricum TaxID=472368 RepID=A0A2Z7CIL6_9LAMI|nr:transmembrane protein 184C [Dorcoceras hygrometricum]
MAHVFAGNDNLEITSVKIAAEEACGMESAYLFPYEHPYRHLHVPALIIAGFFVFIALSLSLYLTLQHLRTYNNPAEQKWIVVVICMVPAYATESILSLCNPKLSLTCDILRSCYEAFALYAFGSYLIGCLGGELRVLDFLEDEAKKQISKPLLEGKKDPRVAYRTYCNFVCRPHVLGKDLFTIIKFGLVQYMILKTLCALLTIVLELCGVYGDGQFKWYYGYPYITVVLNFSQMWALYCLVQFYNVAHEELDPIRPLAKFISFKAIVFATWWQGVGIVLLCTFKVLPDDGKFKTGMQDFLICIEMAIAAIAHIFVFSPKAYHIVLPSHYGKVTTQETKAVVKVKDGDEEKPALLETKETEIKAPGTSVKESVQDIVVEGGQKIVEDVVLTINQAIEPVHEGMTKIQDRIHKIAVSGNDKEEPRVKVVEEHQRNIIREPRV